ncbi:MAG: hypothetical protein WC799_10280 [Desulfobacteraceae bacterium]|jgi:hypothetical protein
MWKWVVTCAVLVGLVPLISGGEPINIFSGFIVGALLGVILYGAYVALTSAISAAGIIPIMKGIDVKKMIWLVIFLVAVIIQAMQSNIGFAFGATIPSFIAGMVLSPIWWGVTKKNRKLPWKWFDWMNAGSYIMIGLLILSPAIEEIMKSQ